VRASGTLGRVRGREREVRGAGYLRVKVDADVVGIAAADERRVSRAQRAENVQMVVCCSLPRRSVSVVVRSNGQGKGRSKRVRKWGQ